MKQKLLILFIYLFSVSVFAQQADRWQQKVKYEMNIDMNVETNQFTGTQKLTYTNNSPDVLDKVFYHLYFNAFQPGSMMDIRSQNIPDPDKRVAGRFKDLKPDEIGYLRVDALTMNGKKVKYEEVGTILEVQLKTPIKAGETVVFDMEFNGQVPIQIRRSGRDNKEGIRYSMSQWYPKLSEYDYQGWHANPYIGREFHGVWGDFDVKLTIDKDYVVGGTGYLQNAQEIGHGYEDKNQPVNRPAGDKLTWHFVAPNVHDFMWAADPDYKHVTAKVPNGPTLHFLYQEGDKTKNWAQLPEYTIKAFEFLSKNYGKYPYEQYSVIQGGDGGMEYPMATLITGHRKIRSLVGVTVHEALHSWYQMILGTNESLYSWMDEGFTSYASAVTMNHLFGDAPDDGIHSGSYQGYRYIATSGKEEPLTTHADHFNTNVAYGLAAYSKGAVFLHQLEYIIGKEAFDKGMLDYFNTWKFRHPNPNDFIRVMEKTSGLELDWYKEYWVNTTHRIDYTIESVIETDDGKTEITLKRIGKIPMPIDVEVKYKKKTKNYYMPLVIMRGEKPAETKKREVLDDWAWTNPTYTFTIPVKKADIKSIKIDPTKRMADINQADNRYTRE